ncbi:hypothetical protein [Arcobacter sp. CECT 8985]|uniref:hypothetical protein n=1 Tax=Arcobacter sp. CECT 8985 TaxID=1935424 RepID=UPI002159C690|nr:hypothetical protein [Arcobacter sp. CECT 8985]
MSKLEVLKNSDFILCFGQFLANTNENIVDFINYAKNTNGAQVVYMHAVDSLALKDFYTQFIKYEAGSEEGVSALLLDTLVQNPSDKIKAYIDDLDIGYISAESSAGEEEFEEILEKSKNSKSKVLFVGDDIFSHGRVENIKKMLTAIDKYSDFEVVCESEFRLDNEELEEVEELLPYNGTVIYSYVDKQKDESIVYASASFIRIAKVNDKDKIKLISSNDETVKTIKLDDTLQSTIAICSTKEKGDDFLSCGYIYKPVKIERLED